MRFVQCPPAIFTDQSTGQQGRVAVIGGSEESVSKINVKPKVEYPTHEIQLHWRPVFLGECFGITRHVYVVFLIETFN